MHEKLKSVMKEKHITGYKLSQLTGIAISDVYCALRGDKKMYNGWKQRIADALEMSVDELFPEEAEKGGDADE